MMISTKQGQEPLIRPSTGSHMQSEREHTLPDKREKRDADAILRIHHQIDEVEQYAQVLQHTDIEYQRSHHLMWSKEHDSAHLQQHGGCEELNDGVQISLRLVRSMDT